MRPSDKDIDREIREGKKAAEAADRALAVRAVTEWNTLMQRGAPPARLVADRRRRDRRPVLFSRRLLPWLQAAEAGRSTQAQAARSHYAARPYSLVELPELPAASAVREAGTALAVRVAEREEAAGHAKARFLSPPNNRSVIPRKLVEFISRQYDNGPPFVFNAFLWPKMIELPAGREVDFSSLLFTDFQGCRHIAHAQRIERPQRVERDEHTNAFQQTDNAGIAHP